MVYKFTKPFPLVNMWPFFHMFHRIQYERCIWGVMTFHAHNAELYTVCRFSSRGLGAMFHALPLGNAVQCTMGEMPCPP